MLNHPVSSGLMSACMLTLSLCVGQFTSNSAYAQDKVFSGPQPGEPTTPFNTIELKGENQGATVDSIQSNGGKPTTLVFVHGIERSMAPLMKVIDAFGTKHKEKIITNWVFLSDDPISSRQRLPLVGRSLKIQGRMLLSSDGIEGPGNYGLNKDCLLTVIAAKENKVAANFALIQPGIADGKTIIEALSTLIGLETPPSIESLTPNMRMAGGRTMRGEANSRTQRRGQNMQPGANRPKGGNLPGAAPTDDRLVGYLRQFIQKSNSNERVNTVLDQVKAYIKDDTDLTKQAMNGWIRVLHVKYGTDYAQTQGAAFVSELKKQFNEE